MNELVQVKTEGFIKTITLNLPKYKNPITPEMFVLLRDAIMDTYQDDSRVVILTGAGGNFSSGASLSPDADISKINVTQTLREGANPTILAMRNCPKPIIAQVQGVCVGIGFNYALACDMILAGKSAVFSQIFTKIGLSSDGGGAYFLQQKVGYHKAFELMAFAEFITAEQALDYNIINHLVEDSELEGTVKKIAERIANGPYIAIKNTKRNLVAAENGTLSETLEAEAINQGVNFKSKDFLEGITAFAQKRPPKFTGE